MKNGPMKTMERMQQEALRAATLHAYQQEAEHTGAGWYDDGDEETFPQSDWLRGAVLQRLCALFDERYPEYVAAPELDARVAVREIRRPDLAVQKRELIAGLYPDRETPLFLAVELLSTGARKQFAGVVAKAERVYKVWGVAHVWIVDAHTRQCWHSGNGFRTPVAWLEAGGLRLGRDEIFETLDRLGPEG
jgi:hypothetical protein